MGHSAGAYSKKHSFWSVTCLAVLVSVICAGSLAPVNAQAPGMSGRVEQLQARQAELGRTRRALLLKEDKLLKNQAQLANQMAEVGRDLKKPLSPDEKYRKSCRLQTLSTEYRQQRQELSDTRQELARILRRLNRTRQQLTQAQQQAAAQAAAQQRDAAPPRPDPLGERMRRPVRPLAGLPIPLASTVAAQAAQPSGGPFAVFTNPGPVAYGGTTVAGHFVTSSPQVIVSMADANSATRIVVTCTITTTGMPSSFTLGLMGGGTSFVAGSPTFSGGFSGTKTFTVQLTPGQFTASVDSFALMPNMTSPGGWTWSAMRAEFYR